MNAPTRRVVLVRGSLTVAGLLGGRDFERALDVAWRDIEQDTLDDLSRDRLTSGNLADLVRISQGQLAESEEKLEQTIALNIDLEDALRAKEMEIILLGDENKVVQSTLEAKVALISALQKQLSEIEADAEKLESRLTAAEAEKEALASSHEEQVKAISAETERQIEEFNRKFAALMDRLGEKEDLIVALNTERKDLELTLAKQRKAYLVLEDKYQRLIRPARSPLGKEVVTVQYSRQNGQYRILYKEPQSDGFEPVGRKELQTRLDQLKGRWQDKLYIKIVIPEQSGLSDPRRCLGLAGLA